MKHVVRTAVLAFAGSLVASGIAAAATLRTPFILASTSVYCFATNIGTKPTDVAVVVKDAAGATLATSTNTCGTPLAPQSSCFAQVSTLSSTPFGGVCSFTSSGKLRAIGYGESGGTILVPVPATK